MAKVKTEAAIRAQKADVETQIALMRGAAAAAAACGCSSNFDSGIVALEQQLTLLEEQLRALGVLKEAA